MDDVAEVGENEGDDLLGDGVGVGARGVHHVDAALAGVLRVDRVVARAGADDDLQVGQAVDELGRDDLAADDQGVGVGIGGDNLLDGRLRVLDDRVVAVLREDLRGDSVEFRGYQDFFHASSTGPDMVSYSPSRFRTKTPRDLSGGAGA